MIRIHGGWANVPDNLKTKTMLDREGLKPAGEPISEVWGGHQWYKLYDSTKAVPKRIVSDKQREANSKSLEKARAKSVTDRTCSHCGEVVPKKEISSDGNGERICNYCTERIA